MLTRRSRRTSLSVETMESRELLSALTPAMNTRTREVLPRDRANSRAGSEVGVPLVASLFAAGSQFAVRGIDSTSAQTGKIITGSQPLGGSTLQVSTPTMPTGSNRQVLDFYFQRTPPSGSPVIPPLGSNGRFTVGPIGTEKLPIKFSPKAKVDSIYLYFTTNTTSATLLKSSDAVFGIEPARYKLKLGTAPTASGEQVFYLELRNATGKGWGGPFPGFRMFDPTGFTLNVKQLLDELNVPSTVNGIHIDLEVSP